MQKQKTMKVSYPHANPQAAEDAANDLYRVETVTDSLDVSPGDFLNADQLKGFINNEVWMVTIAKVRRS